MREIQHRLVQRLAFAEEERDEQAADAAVAIEERMNRLELSVGESDFDQQWQAIRFVQERLEVAQSGGYFVRRRRDERGVRERRGAGPDPVLTPTQLARGQTRSADPLQQLRMDFTNQ